MIGWRVALVLNHKVLKGQHRGALKAVLGSFVGQGRENRGFVKWVHGKPVDGTGLNVHYRQQAKEHGCP